MTLTQKVMLLLELDISLNDEDQKSQKHLHTLTTEDHF